MIFYKQLLAIGITLSISVFRINVEVYFHELAHNVANTFPTEPMVDKIVRAHEGLSK